MSPHRLFAIALVVTLGLALGGCSRCGWFWESPKSCLPGLPDDTPKR